MERNSLFLFKPTASLCFSEKILSSGTRVLCPSMSDGGRGCFYVGCRRFHRVGRGGLCFTVQLHTGICKSCLEQDGGSGMGKYNCVGL